MAGLIAAIVAAALGLANSITGAIYSSTSGKAIKEKIAQLTKIINDDMSLRNRLMDAYNSKNPMLLNNVVNSIPGGFAHQVAKLEKQIKEQVHQDKISRIDENISNNTARQNALMNHQIDPYNQITNAINTDWYDRNKHNLNATEHEKRENGKYIIKDQYGKDNVVSQEQLETWTYGKPTENQTIKPDSNTRLVYEKGK